MEDYLLDSLQFMYVRGDIPGESWDVHEDTPGSMEGAGVETSKEISCDDF